MKPSVFTQLEGCTQVGTRLLKPSPRHWNPGMFRYKDRLWMTYRYHLEEPGGRCATAITEIDPKTLQPKGKSQWVPLKGPTGTEHHEDARLFIFRGEPYISYTEMSSFRPTIDYICVMRYAKLRFKAEKWDVVETWQPIYGANNGNSKEKNWVFFEHEDKLMCVYSSWPRHVVLEIEGEHVVQVHEADPAVWHFGQMRGGTPPVRLPDGNLLSIFHSSVPTEIKPHYVRYYGAAYTFSGKPPFTPLQVSTTPLMVGSESDGHRMDPRNPDRWKPYVVFPCGLVDDGDNWLVSLGVNDWQCAIGRLRKDGLALGARDGSDIRPRYFKRNNGSLPIMVLDEGNQRAPLSWYVPKGLTGMVAPGYMVVANARQAQDVAESPGVQEIPESEYNTVMLRRGSTHSGNHVA